MPSTIRRVAIVPLYELLTGDEDARACRDIPDSACREQPTSFFLHLASALLSKIADELASARLVMTWLLAAVGAPAFMAGLLVPIRESGSLLPQLAIAGYMRRLARRKWLWVAGALIQAVALAATGAVPFVLDGAAAGWSVIGLLIVFSLARGMSSVAHKDVLGKTIDRARRGTVMGYAASLAGFATLGVGAWLASFDAASTSPALFGWLLGCAAVLWVGAAWLFAGLPEAAGATEGGANALVEAMRSLTLLRTDADFRNFLITRALMLSGALALPFIAVLATERAGASVQGLGALLLASGIGASVSAPVWGRLADRSSRLVMAASSALAGALGLAVFALDASGSSLLQHSWAFAALFAIAAAAHGGMRLGRKTYLVDLATPGNRAAYVAVGNTLIGLLLLAAGALGVLAQVLGAGATILVLALVSLAAAAVALRLPELGH